MNRRILIYILCLVYLAGSSLWPHGVFADDDYDFTTGICNRTTGYAEFRRKTESDVTREDLKKRSNVIHEHDLPGPGGENSWRCDLADNATVTVRYRIPPFYYSSCSRQIDLAIWLNGVGVYNKEFENCEGKDVLGFFSVDKAGLKIYSWNSTFDYSHPENGHKTTNKTIAISWPSISAKTDPAYKPGWAFGEPKAQAIKVAPRLVTGKGNPLCETIQSWYSTNTENEIHDGLWCSGNQTIESVGCGPNFILNSNDEAFYKIDIDNDGKEELVQKVFVFYRFITGTRFIIYKYGLFDNNNPKDCSLKPKEYWYRETTNGGKSNPHENGGVPFAYMSLPDVYHFFNSDYICHDQKKYIVAVANNEATFVYGKKYDEITRIVYELFPDEQIKILCEFTPPYSYFDEKPTNSTKGAQ